DANAVRHRAVQLATLAGTGVDIANGGWGKGSFLRWNRAHNDVTRAGKVIAREAGVTTREFIPGRAVDAFDQYYSRKGKQRPVVANHILVPGRLPAHFAPSK